MTPKEEKDYQEVLRCIEEAEKSGAVTLKLSGLLALDRFPPEL